MRWWDRTSNHTGKRCNTGGREWRGSTVTYTLTSPFSAWVRAACPVKDQRQAQCSCVSFSWGTNLLPFQYVTGSSEKKTDKKHTPSDNFLPAIFSFFITVSYLFTYNSKKSIFCAPQKHMNENLTEKLNIFFSAKNGAIIDSCTEIQLSRALLPTRQWPFMTENTTLSPLLSSTSRA